MLAQWVVVVASAGLATSSLYSGAEEVCGLAGCSCITDTVTCTCTRDSSFQESFTFIDPRRQLRHLRVSGCSRLVLPVQAVGTEVVGLATIAVTNVQHVEVHAGAITVSQLRQLNFTDCGLVTFQSGALKAGLAGTDILDLRLSNIEHVQVKGPAFASLQSFTAEDVAKLTLEQHSFQLRVNTDQPTIEIKFVNVSVPSLSSSVFPSSFKSILIEDSRIENIATNAFSGLTIPNIRFLGTTIQRIERGAFANTAAISSLHFHRCKISSLSQRAVVAGVTTFLLTHSEVQSIAKMGAIAVTVASVRIEHNRFKTLATEAFQFTYWDEVIINNNTFGFVEEGAINGIKDPSEELDTSFAFTNNRLVELNRGALVTQIPETVVVSVAGNKFGRRCDCSMEAYIKSISGFTELTSPFVDLTASLNSSSTCRLGRKVADCFQGTAALLPRYRELLCGSKVPSCVRQEEGDDDVIIVPDEDILATFTDEFVLLFQVKTTKGILLFLLFCVLSSVATVTICVAAIWVNRLCRRAKLSRSHMSGSFQFNSGEEKQVLYGSDQTTCSLGEEEPQYAEIAEVHPHPAVPSSWVTLPASTTASPFHTSTMETTLPSLATSTLPIRGDASLPPIPRDEAGETASLLSGSLETTQISRLSMSETSLTDDIMSALRDKLNDPMMYMSVADAKACASPQPASPVKVVEEEVYCAPLYSDPLPQ